MENHWCIAILLKKKLIRISIRANYDLATSRAYLYLWESFSLVMTKESCLE